MSSLWAAAAQTRLEEQRTLLKLLKQQVKKKPNRTDAGYVVLFAPAVQINCASPRTTKQKFASWQAVLHFWRAHLS